MPSIPQSLLWISLVILWLFVLVPMLINKRDTVRRTSDVALATRVVNSGRASRLFRRGGPAAGHRSDPHWRPEVDTDDFDEEETGPVVVTSNPSRARSVAVSAPAPGKAEPDYLDVDIVDVDSGALPVGEMVAESESEEPPVVSPAAEARSPETPESAEGAGGGSESTNIRASSSRPIEGDATADEYEYVHDTSGLEVEADEPVMRVPRSSRYSTTRAAEVSARKYRFRTRALITMAVLLIGSAAVAFLWTPSGWYLCAGLAATTLLYLGYLRRQTRIEERLRHRRLQRMARSRLGVENTEDHDLDVVPSRLRRPGAAVLDIDEEDPVFEHLDSVAFARGFDLPRAAGQ
jgi:hypothetical protein